MHRMVITVMMRLGTPVCTDVRILNKVKLKKKLNFFRFIKMIQQHPPSLGARDLPPSNLTLFPSLAPAAEEDPILHQIKKPYLSLICLAMVKKACSTLVAFLADVSKKGMES